MYIKVFARNQSRVSIRANHYGSSLAHFKAMFAELKKDFPAARPDQIEVVLYGGSTFKDMWGIEYDVKNSSAVPASYVRWNNLEITQSARCLNNTKHASVKLQAPGHCLIRTRGKGNSLQVFLDFFRELRKDFPRLTETAVKLENYGGNTYRYTFGMEFETPATFNVPSSYRKISELELTL
jgi:hypothetical protein